MISQMQPKPTRSNVPPPVTAVMVTPSPAPPFTSVVAGLLAPPLLLVPRVPQDHRASAWDTVTSDGVEIEGLMLCFHHLGDDIGPEVM